MTRIDRVVQGKYENPKILISYDELSPKLLVERFDGSGVSIDIEPDILDDLGGLFMIMDDGGESQ